MDGLRGRALRSSHNAVGLDVGLRRSAPQVSPNSLSKILHQQEEVQRVCRRWLELGVMKIAVAGCIVLGVDEQCSDADFVSRSVSATQGVDEQCPPNPRPLCRCIDRQTCQQDNRHRVTWDAPRYAGGGNGVLHPPCGKRVVAENVRRVTSARHEDRRHASTLIGQRMQPEPVVEVDLPTVKRDDVMSSAKFPRLLQRDHYSAVSKTVGSVRSLRSFGFTTVGRSSMS